MAEKFYHINAVVSDINQSIDFYASLGFVLDHRVHPIGESLVPHLGLESQDLQAAIMKFPGEKSMMLDLVEFVQPIPVGLPYTSLTNVGIARFSIFLKDFAAGINNLDSRQVDYFGPSVEYVSPLGVAMITKMAKGPDGECVQLISEVGDHLIERTEDIFHINVVVADMAKSLEFYEAIGFSLLGDVVVEHPDLGVPFGEEVTKMRGAFLSLTGNPDDPMLDLVEIIEPSKLSKPYATAHNLGLVRFALWTNDLDRDIQSALNHGGSLLAPAIEFVGPEGVPVITQCVQDPDGTLVQFFAGS